MEGGVKGAEAEGDQVRGTVEEVAERHGVCLRAAAAGGRRDGRLLFAMTAGSVAFNLALPTSDRDYFAVYAADTQRALGLTRPVPSVDCHDPDLQMYEAARYCELLLKGNPKVIEPLFAEHFTWQSEEWGELKKLRHHLITQVTVDQYVSYSLSQVGDYLKGRGAAPPAKKFYHAIRLMQEAKRLILNGAPRVWYDDEDPDRATLLAIRRGEKDAENLVSQLQSYREEINTLKTNLPEKTDPRVLSEWLVYLRCKLLSEDQPVTIVRTDMQSSTLNEECDHEGLELRDKALNLLNSFDVEGRILCCIPSGSQAHGLANESSGEADYVAVYVAPTTAVVGLLPPPQRVDAHGPDSKQKETYARGMLVFEAGHACHLLAQGNHRLLEALFFDEQMSKLASYQTPAWRQLRATAGAGLITQTALNHYLGVAQGQLQAKTPTRVNLYHAFRLLMEAQHMLGHRSPPRVCLPHDEITFLLRVRRPQPDDDSTADGEYSINSLLERAKAQATAITARKDSLPLRTDREPLDRWLASLRSSLLS